MWKGVLRCGVNPVNRNLVRCFPLRAAGCAIFLSLLTLPASSPLSAHPDALADGVTKLARKAAALPHERRMSLIWTNHSALSERRVERLRAVFAAEMEDAQVRWVQGESAPALRVFIEQTPSRIVFTASVPGNGNSSAAMEEVARALVGIESEGNAIRLEKELLWRQEARILSAAQLPPNSSGEERLVVLGEEELTIFRREAGGWSKETSKALPGPRQPQRGERGQLLLVEGQPEQVVILLPGKRCEANLADPSPVTCVAASMEWPSGRLMGLPACGTRTWWLRSGDGDFTTEDRLVLRSTNAAKEAPPAAEVEVAGPVFSISSGPSADGATVTLRDVGSGNYEVYRVALACGH